LAPTRRGIVSSSAFVAATLVLALIDALTRDRERTR
jgi:shikimate kinase